MNDAIIARFPATFAADHYETRLLPSGALIERNQRHYIFAIKSGTESYEGRDKLLTAKEVLEEWVSDADYYTWMLQDGVWRQGAGKPLCLSAKRTLRIARELLEKHFPKHKPVRVEDLLGEK